MTVSESLSAIINMLSDPHDACDFGDSEVEALRQTINDAIASLLDLRRELEAALRVADNSLAMRGAGEGSTGRRALRAALRPTTRT